MSRIEYLAVCQTCAKQFGPGDEKVDREAEKHVKATQHAVITSLKVVRDE